MEKSKFKLHDFWTISLSELNSKASFLKRKDRKYLLSAWEFFDVLEKLKDNFDILEIKGQKIFSYDNVYMDTEDHLFYNQHQNRKKSRVKVRTRYYLDSDLAFFEFKHKNKWVTTKYRYEFPSEEHGFMTKGKKRFFEWVWQSINYWEKAPKLSPSIRTKYKRITLVNKTNSERLTIDFDIRTYNLRDNKVKEVNLKNLVIVESKSMSQKSDCTKIMESFSIEKSKSCSKYSLWVIYSWLAKKFDTFIETMEQIKQIRLSTLKNRIRRSKSINKVPSNKKLIKQIDKIEKSYC